MTKLLIQILFLFLANVLYAQQPHEMQDYTVIKQSKWIIPNNDTLAYAFSTYQGEKALLLKRNILNAKSASIAYPKHLDFKDGIIELDLASPVGSAGYIGLAFRIKDEQHYETLYFRPGYSGTINAVQYMPEKKSEFNWWDYEDKKYQAKTALPLKAWFHVKAVVKGNQLTVFVNNQLTPVFIYKPLDSILQQGSVGFWLGNSAVGAYKNLKIINFN